MWIIELIVELTARICKLTQSPRSLRARRSDFLQGMNGAPGILKHARCAHTIYLTHLAGWTLLCA